MLSARAVSFAYGASIVLREVSLDIPHRSVVGILGPNGSGKTTLLKLLSGGLRPVSGDVTLEGLPLRTLSHRELARRIAVVPQETHPAFDYSVLEIALMGRYPWLGSFEIEGPADLAAARAALQATGTADLASRPFPTLSGGEKQRVIIASALAQLDTRTAPATEDSKRRALLLLDEPTTSLDLRYQIGVASLIRRLHDAHDVTIVLSTHDLRLVAAVCTSVVLLTDGQVLAKGQPSTMLTPELIGRLYRVDADQVVPHLAT